MYLYTELDTCLCVCEMYVYTELDTCLSVCVMFVYTDLYTCLSVCEMLVYTELATCLSVSPAGGGREFPSCRTTEGYDPPPSLCQPVCRGLLPVSPDERILAVERVLSWQFILGSLNTLLWP